MTHSRNMQRFGIALLLAGTLAWAQGGATQTLCGALKPFKGWQTEQCDAIEMADPMGGDMIIVSQVSVQKDKTVNLSIVTGSRAQMAQAQFQRGYALENDKMLMKTMRVDGFPVSVTYDKTRNQGGLTVQLSKRAILVLTFEGMSWQEALELLKQEDWKALRKEVDAI